MDSDSEVDEILYCRTDIDAEGNVQNIASKYAGHSGDESQDAQRISRHNYEDRFLVDRKKLEQLILGHHDFGEHAEGFFELIMEETKTMIDWPRRLKIGAKTRKDPYIRIHGSQSNVKDAKKRVLSLLEPKRFQVIMKMDICYTDHSHIIGRGGETIRQVMEETGCHIHFPDSNRSNPHEKSNQVSISGNIVGVEKARQQLRMLAPVKFAFELPAMSPVDESSPSVSQIIEMVQERYNVHVVLRKGPKLFSDVILVKGSEEELVKTETATRVLIQKLCHSSEGEVPVQMTMEISPQHHSMVRGVNSCNLKEIMMQTSTIIIFPDAMDPNLPPLKKSTVTISGSIHNVYLARQRLLGSLPLVLMFNVAEEHVGIENCNNIMELLDVVISVRLKPKYGTYSVHIKCLERHADKLYKSRQMLLNSNEPTIRAEIPASYFGQGSSLNSSGKGVQRVLQRVIQSPISSPENPAASNTAADSLGWRLSSKRKCLIPSIMHHDCGNFHSMTLDVDENGCLEQEDSKESGRGLLHVEVDKSEYYDSCSHEEDNFAGSSNVSSLSSTSKSPMASPRSGSINLQGIDSGYGETCEWESSRPISGIPYIKCENKEELFVDEQLKLSFSDYENKQAMALKAMQNEPDSSKLRVSNTKWSGFGFSHSMPGSVLKSKVLAQIESSQEVDKGQGAQLACPSEDDSEVIAPSLCPSMTTDGVTLSAGIDHSVTDLFSLLRRIGMARYSYIFTSNEVDMVTFMTLDDNDLRFLGIPTYVARQKILRAISELRKKHHFNGDAAPGADIKAKFQSTWE